MPDDEYKVGYCQPPKKTQFKKGQSGNPSGRSKGSKNRKPFLSDNFSQIILDEFNASVPVYKDGNAVTMSKLKIIVSQLVKLGASGDIKSISKCLDLAQSIAKQDDKEFGLMHKHNTKLACQKRERIAQSVGCELDVAKRTVDWQLHEKYTTEDSLRDIFGEEEFPYSAYSPRTREDWEHLDEELAVNLDMIARKCI